MKILLTGKNGQVGFELAKKLNTLGEVIATDREELDLANPDAIRAFIDQTKPDIIINPAAYTAVDKAESEPDLAYRINTLAPEVLALMAAELDIPLIHFSTDYVFDGLKKEAYVETDKTNPQSVYGKTKNDGEEKIRKHPKHIILRTSWVFGSHGGNFLKTILRLIQERNQLSIVSDQWGSPASAAMLSDVTYAILKSIFETPQFNDYGTYHVTCEGETNWHHYAQLVASKAIELGLTSKIKPDAIQSIKTIDYPTPAKRPFNSRLNTHKLEKVFMLKLPHWQDEVTKTLKALI
ncbi:dTDP-4-dehydrorhamnose reductase [Candidatus Methylopumilus universalis]|uniref:dTDP-4-dehydrorhamnose reductase n=1 Tax=Candidatus Methylopumilus universalis TaxID=2588536 RepID=UPI0011233119|nr:dTDP-4-dehydrorhamnose reductase [Candidatus Methylopumilus universalis]QDC96520.1 dTDP-4-dehydrorhamnose reductase [Candidatus Methylopumilus universalis]